MTLKEFRAKMKKAKDLLSKENSLKISGVNGNYNSVCICLNDVFSNYRIYDYNKNIQYFDGYVCRYKYGDSEAYGSMVELFNLYFSPHKHVFNKKGSFLRQEEKDGYDGLMSFWLGLATKENIARRALYLETFEEFMVVNKYYKYLERH